MSDCPGCGVEPGDLHIDGCGVAPCKECGFQAIMCKESNKKTTWTGRWPGAEEIEAFGLLDQNELYHMALDNRLTWNKDTERWLLR